MIGVAPTCFGNGVPFSGGLGTQRFKIWTMHFR